MPSIDLPIDAFNGGEISPRAQGRIMLLNYKAGAGIMENLIPQIAGGLERRPGTRYVAAATGTSGLTDSTSTSTGSWLIPFLTSVGASYICEFSDYKLRFFRDGGALLHSHAVFNEFQVNTTANQFDIPGHGFRHGQVVTYVADGTVITGLVDGADYMVVLPEAMRSIDPTNAGLYEKEGDEEFNFDVQMGPYHIVHGDVNTSLPQQDVFITLADDVDTCKVGLIKGGPSHDPAGDAGADGVSLIPTLGCRVNTFRLATLGIYDNAHELRKNVKPLTGVGAGRFEVKGNPPVELDSPFSYEEAKVLQWTSEADTMILTSPDNAHPPWELLRFGTSSFVLQTIQFRGGPLGPESPLGVNTDMTVSVTDPMEAGTHQLITCDSDFFQASDVGLPFRKSWDPDKPSLGLKWQEFLIHHIGTSGTGYVQFVVHEDSSTGTSANVITLGAGHTLLDNDEVWVWPKDEVGYVFPPEISIRTIYHIINRSSTTVKLSLTSGGPAITLSNEAGGMRLVNAYMFSVVRDDSDTALAHGFEDGVDYPGLWFDGIPPTGLESGGVYRIKKHASITDRFKIQKLDGTDLPIKDIGSGKFLCSATSSPVASARGVIAEFVDNITGAPDTDAVDASAASHRWRIGVWGPRNGWPGACTIQQERLLMGGSSIFPMTAWSSQLAQIRNYSPDERTGTTENPGAEDRTITDVSGWSYQLDSEGTEKILWMHPSTIVVVGTTGPIHTLEGLTPTTVTSFLMTSRGTTKTRPVISDAQIIWATADHSVFAAGFREERAAYVPEDLTIVADHMFTKNNQLVQMALQEKPWSLIWGIREDGQLVSCTYDQLQGVKAWARHPIGGKHSFNEFDHKEGSTVTVVREHAAVKSIATVPSSDNRTDNVWMVVERLSPLSNSPTSVFRTIELMSKRFEIDDRKEHAEFVDCQITPIDRSSALDPLETITTHDVLFNRVLDLWIDGAIQPQQTASAVGLITYPTPADYKVVLGIPFRWRWDSLSVEAIAQDIPTLKGIQGSIMAAQIFLLNSLGGQMGDPNEALQDFDFRSVLNTPMDEGPALFTGNYEVEAWPGIPGRTQVITLRGTGPEPWFLTHIVVKLDGGVDSR